MSSLTGRTPRDANRVPATYGVSSVDGVAVTPIEVNPSTGRLLVDIGSGAGGGVQYVEGVTTSPATGTAALGRYLASAPGTLADGALSAPLLDNFGQLKVVPVGTSSVNVAQIAGTTTAVSTGATSAGVQRAILTNDYLSTVLSKITDGTNTANVQAGDTGFNGISTASATKTFTFTTSASGAQMLLSDTDCRGYSWIEVVYTSVGSGLAIQGQFTTVAAGTYVTSSTFGSSANGVGGGLGSTVNIIYSSPVRGNFFRLNVTALSSGTLTGTVTLRSISPAMNTITANQSGTWTVGANSATGSAVPVNAFYMGMQNGSGSLAGLNAAGNVADNASGNGVLATSMYAYNGSNQDRLRVMANATNTTGVGILATGMLAQLDDTSPTVPTENQFANLRMSVDRSLLTTIQNTYAHISTSTTTTVKSGAGTLHTVTVGTLGTVASTTTIYDNTAGSGTVIGVINTLALGGTFTFDVQFITGLTLVTTGTVAPDITVSYK